MKRSLSIPKGPKQQLFLAYLNAEFAKRTKRAQAHFESRELGAMVNVVQSTMGELDGQVELIWLFRTSVDGTLAEIEVHRSDKTGDTTWEELATEIIDSALTNAFNETRRKELSRRVFFYIGPQLDGEYWFRRVRVAPAILDDDYPTLLNAERAVVIEFEVAAIDMLDASYLASEIARRIAARLSLLLNVDLYEPSQNMVWVMSDTHPKVDRLQRGVGEIPGGNRMPKKGEICRAGALGDGIRQYGRMIGTLKMPPEARRILRAVDALPEPVKDAFDGAARLYQIGLSLGRRFPSAELAYRVSAIEALSAIDSEANSFSTFMRKHLLLMPSDTKLLEYLYGDIRSSHFHAGKFDLGEFSAQRHMDIVSSPQVAIRRRQQDRCFELTRQAIVNWMLSIAGKPDV